jgi:hypothetical protein
MARIMYKVFKTFSYQSWGYPVEDVGDGIGVEHCLECSIGDPQEYEESDKPVEFDILSLTFYLPLYASQTQGITIADPTLLVMSAKGGIRTREVYIESCSIT